MIKIKAQPDMAANERPAWDLSSETVHLSIRLHTAHRNGGKKPPLITGNMKRLMWVLQGST